jgi:hypothetical protein
MEIHGIRFYPDSVETVPGAGAPIFVHGSVSEECSDFVYAFRPLASAWQGCFFANDFPASMDEHGRVQDPIPDLRERYGTSFVAADPDIQIVLLRGDDFAQWAPLYHFQEGAFLPVFCEPPAFDVLKRLFWRDFRLTSETWPSGMIALFHMWDDMYWQIFTTDRGHIDTLIGAHAGDPKLDMYFVELDREYPDPSNEPLQPVAPRRTDRS